MEYRVLGSLEVLDRSGHRLPLGGARQQTVLASLLLRAGRTVPVERLVDELWEKPPQKGGGDRPGLRLAPASRARAARDRE